MTFIASIGASFEYYDFIIYGLLATYIGKNFFPSGNETTQLFEAFSVFALGYVTRPIGGILFGNRGDRVGRKPVFLLSILLMGMSTFLIGLLPTYEQIGVSATVILIILRALQGMAFGSEIPGTITFLIEHNQFQHRGFHTSIALSSISLGAALGMVIVLMLNESLTVIQMTSYGWRIPFLIGGVLALISFYIRHHLHETPVFLAYIKNNGPSNKQPIINLLRHYPVSILLGIGLSLLSASLVVFGISLPAILRKFSHYDANHIYFNLLIGYLWAALILPILGWTSDKMGQIRQIILTTLLLIIAIIGYFISPALYILMPLTMFIIIYQTFVASITNSYLPVLAGMFPANIRFTGVAFCYNLAYAVAAFLPAIIAKF